MDVLRQHGYEVYGMDVAAAAIQHVIARGLPGSRGEISEYPSTWPDVDVDVDVVCLVEVLEHLEAPDAALAAIRRRFPRALLLLTVPSPKFWGARHGRVPSDYPPNHLTRWTREALERLLTRIGYAPSVETITPVASEWSGTGLIRRIRGRPRGPGSGPTGVPIRDVSSMSRYVALAKWIVLWPYLRYLRSRGATASSMFAVGRPL